MGVASTPVEGTSACFVSWRRGYEPFELDVVVAGVGSTPSRREGHRDEQRDTSAEIRSRRFLVPWLVPLLGER